MTEAQRALWERLESFPIDGGATTHGFARRLARENGWSRPFTARAIEEYRRFLLLLGAAGHPVSPSPVIDEVWHLHLLFTNSYWRDLCRETVGKPLHHVPSQDSATDAPGFAQWYADTLARYREVFGSDPPADIWPEPGAPSPVYRRVDLRTQWVFDKPTLSMVFALLAFVVLMLLFAVGCGSVALAQTLELSSLYLLDWRGPSFLRLYTIVAPMGLLLAALVRRMATTDTSRQLGSAEDLDLYERAYLHSGAIGLWRTAIVSLIERDYIRMDIETDRIHRRDRAKDSRLNALERTVLRALPDSGARLEELRMSERLPVESVSRRLIDDGLVVNPSRADSAELLSSLLAWSPVVLGAAKVGVGIYRDRPVEYLVLATMLAGALAYAVCSRRLFRTRYGKRVLRSLQREHDTPSSSISKADGVASNVALFGVVALAGTPLAFLQRPFYRLSGAGGRYGGDPGTGCGGGGDGGAGGCGGCGSD